MAFPQQTGLGIGPAIGEFSEFQGDQIEMMQIGGHQVGRLPWLQAQPDRAVECQDFVAMPPPGVQVNNDWTHGRQGLCVSEIVGVVPDVLS